MEPRKRRTNGWASDSYVTLIALSRSARRYCRSSRNRRGPTCSRDDESCGRRRGYGTPSSTI